MLEAAIRIPGIAPTSLMPMAAPLPTTTKWRTSWAAKTALKGRERIVIVTNLPVAANGSIAGAVQAAP